MYQPAGYYPPPASQSSEEGLDNQCEAETESVSRKLSDQQFTQVDVDQTALLIPKTFWTFGREYSRLRM